MDSHKIVKLEMDAAKDNYDEYMDLKVEEYQLLEETNIEIDSRNSSSGIMEPLQEVKKESDASGDNYDYNIEVKVEDHPIEVEIKKEIEHGSIASFLDSSHNISCNSPDIAVQHYNCQDCNYTTVNMIHFENHIQAHIIGKTHKCSHCEKGFRKKGDLVRHQRTHTGEKPYQCSQCNKCFANKGALDTHQ